MEEWINSIAPLIGIAGLWWKLTTSMATKAELNAMRSDMSDMNADLKADMVALKATSKRKTRSYGRTSVRFGNCYTHG